MKPITIHQCLTAGLLLGSAFGLVAVPVTFQANMSYQIAQGYFNPATSTISVHGNFTPAGESGWGTAVALTNSPGNTNLYTGTYDVTGTAGNTYSYKLVTNDGSDHWENDPNRHFILGSSAQTLPQAYYNNAWDGLPITVNFQVNMGPQIGAGNYNPNTQAVYVRGSLNGWGMTGITADTINTNLYAGPIDLSLAPGATVEYKYYFGPPDNWESIGNRWFILSNNVQTLPVVYFNDAAGFPIKAAIYFQVDMNPQITLNNFDPTNHQVWVRGNVVGWGDPPAGLQLIEDTARPGIYTNTWTSGGFVTGDQFAYKFVIWKPGATWEGGDNKILVFQGKEPLNADGYHQITVGPVYFNNVPPPSRGDILAQDTTVTFRINMKNAVALSTPTGPFDPTNQNVYVNGAFVPWWTWGSLPNAYQMFDDGINGGDTASGDLIYSWQQVFTRGSLARLEYKYGIQSNDNEAPSGANHVRYIDSSTNTYVLPVDTFGTMYQESEVGPLTLSKQPAGYVTLTWMGRPGINLQTNTNLTSGAWVDVPGTDGISTKVLPLATGQQYYRLVKP